METMNVLFYICMHALADITENSRRATVTIPSEQTQEKTKGKGVYFIYQCMRVVGKGGFCARDTGTQ